MSILEVVALLDETRLAHRRRNEVQFAEILNGGGGPFYFAAGWLESAAALALRQAFPDHQVELNLVVNWGDDATQAKTVLAMVVSNRLCLVSCKNGFVDERVRLHLDRFRAIVGEFDEMWVRPVLLATKRLPKGLKARAAD